MRAHTIRRIRLHPVGLAVLALLGTSPPGFALPQGAQVVAGQVTVGTPAGGRLGIVQSSGRAIVDWRSFGIGTGEAVTLAQPGGGVALFRVTGGEAATLFGSLSATGTLFLSSPGGVLFGANARADVGSLVATTLGIGNTDFLAGRYAFSGDSRASVVNEGTLSAPNGSVVLLGATVANRGTISAPQGAVALGAGSAATLDVYGNGLLKLQLGAGADGARVDHGGTIAADGGTVTAAAQGTGAVLNIGGLIRAQSLTERDGAIYLSGGAGSQLNLSGTLDTSGTTGNGGRIDVRAERIDVAATGVLRADAGARGHGGTVDAIATDAMSFEGRVSTRGGTVGGDGGQAEVSGHGTLAFNGSADTRAEAGRSGTLLLDPGSFTILRSNGNVNTANQISDTALSTLLATTGVTLSTANATNNAVQNLNVDANASVSWSTANTLTLVAGNALSMNNGARFANTSNTTNFDAIVLRANTGATRSSGTFFGISIGAATLSANGGNIVLTGVGGDSGGSNHGIILTSATLSTTGGAITLNGTGGAGAGNINAGVFMQGTTQVTASGSGNIVVTGVGGGQGASLQNVGIAVPVGASVTLTSTAGAVNLLGNGGIGGGSDGVYNAGTLAVTARRQVQVLGISSSGAFGINFRDGTATLAGTNNGNVSLQADRMAIEGAAGTTGGLLSVAPVTAGRLVLVNGENAGALSLSSAELDGLAPSGTLQIGSAAAGNVRVDGAFTPTAGTGTLALLSGATVDVGAAITGGATRLNLNGATGIRLGAALSSTANAVAATRAITLRTPGSFDNAVGAAALSAPNGNWSVSLATPIGQNFNGLLSGSTAVWSNPVTSNVNPTGNRYSFAIAPTVFIDAGTATKVYGDALATTVTLNNVAASSIANTFGGVFTDYANATLGGSYTRSSTGLAATANAGTFNDLTVTNVAGVTTSLTGYTIAAGATGTVTVSPRAVTLTPDAQTRVYGDANPARGTAAATTGTLVNGDTLRDVALSTPAVTLSNVGSYDLTGSGALFSTGLASNYAITYATRTGGLSVTQRPITFGFTGFVGRPYGGGTVDVSQALSTIASGSFAAGDGYTSSVTAGAVPLTAAVGDYAIPQVVSITRGGVNVQSNYAVTVDPATLRVTPRPLTLTPVAVSRAYGDANPATGTAAANSGTGVGLANGDTVSQVSLSSAATAASDVGSYPTTAGNAVFSRGTATNYAITYADNAAGLQVTTRLLTITPGAVTRAYGDANPTTAAAVGNNLVNGNTLGTLTITTAATTTSDVGTYATAGSNAAFTNGLASNYAITYVANTAGLVVAPRALTLTPDAVSRVYGDANPASGIATVTAGTLVGTDALGTVALSSPATAGSFVGTYTLSAGNAVFGSGSASNYAITYADRANGLTITPRPVTLTLGGSVSRPYGGGLVNVAITDPTVTAGSLATGDRVSGWSTQGGPALTAPVGTYAVTFSSASLANAAFQNVTANYAITRVDAPFFVTPRPVTLTPVAVSRTYGDANPATAGATSNSGFGVGLVNGDTVSQLSITSPASATNNVGSFAATGSNAVFATGAASNYAIAYGTNATGLVITPRALTITPDAVSRAYGDANPATAPASGNNLVNGDTIGTVTLGTAATAASNVGTYPTTAGNASFATGLATNYTITYAGNAAGLSVTPRALTITPDAVSRVYGDANPATAPAIGNNLVNGDTLGTLTLATGATPASNVGIQATSGSNAAFATGLASNYAITYADNASGLTITPRPIQLMPDTVTRVYGDANPASATASVVAGSLVNGDTVTGVDLASPATAASNVGAHPTSGSNAVFGTGLASNYDIRYVATAGGLVITPRALTITPDAASRTYGDANPASGTARADNLVNGDTVASVTLTSPATAASPVGRYDLDASAAVFGTGLATNYTIAYATAPGALAVGPRGLTLTPAAVTGVYGNAPPTSAPAVANGLVNGDSVATLAITTPAGATSNAGSYASTGTAALFGSGSASNYTVTFATNPAGVTLDPRPLTLTPVAVARPYGDANPASGNASANNLVNGDTVASVTLASSANPASNVGRYDTTASAAVFGAGLASNYTITYAPNATGLTVTPRPLTLTPDAASRTYGDANPTLGTARADNLVNGDAVASVTLASSATPASNVGRYDTAASAAVFGAGLASNYTITYAPNPAGLTVTPRALTLTPDAVTRAYGDANPASGTAAANNLVNGDTVASVALASPATSADGIGRYGLTASDAQFGSGSAANYAISYAPNPAGLQVVPRPVAVTVASGQFKFTGQADPALTFALTGGTLVGSDAFSGSLARAPGESPGSYPIGQSSLGLGPNYTIAFNGAPFTVTAAGQIATIDRTPAPGAPSSAGAGFAGLLAALPPTAAGNGAATECVREAVLDAAQAGTSRIVNRGIRLPDGVVDACR